ncbi:Uncharacterized conserved protein, DUF1697 family [Flaviramulus basaltis]|uniref:Uncharacterized conserved protein, DUF1697 family n=1 Tax=Flaviramulus basaltis TaxID=369401 RepID=A0A1K2ICE9_9FLAO|nr:DUF1697 domain-containing protein [Flaviramulus basaltis]SFZ89387.1 Uncharacterized conserved protein, DUF1697 family [Flaviramulus basaltis]
MNTFIALLKGINVGGHKKVPMAELREYLTKCGFQNVQTYIQSGNVVFESNEKSIQKIEETIMKAILDHFGFEVSVLVKTREKLKRIFDDSPFSEEKKKASYFMMLHDTPESELVKEASEKIYEDEEYEIIKDCIYFFCEKGYGQAKFNANFFERKLNTFATARNYNTMVKLLSLSAEN